MSIFKTKIRVQKTHPNAGLPSYKHPGDSGMDLSSLDTVFIQPGATELINTGLKFELPENIELQIRPRSGLSLKSKLRIANSPGSVDSNYRGEVKIIAHNTGSTVIVINKGDRIAQAVFCPIMRVELVESRIDVDTSRGSNGFGSTGV